MLQGLKVVRRGLPGISHRRDPARAGRHLDQDVLPFAVEFGGEQTDAGDIAPRVRKRRHQSLADHVLGHTDDRHAAGDGLNRSQGRCRAGDDRIGRRTDQGRRPFAQIVVDGLEATRNDSEISSLDKPIEPQFVEQCLDRR